MRSFLSNGDQTSLLGNLYCDADFVSELIAADEKVMIRERCGGSGINIIDCHYVGLEDFIQDAGGLNMAHKSTGGISPLISQNVTVIPRDWFDRPASSIEDDIVGIRLGDILSKQPRRRWGTLTLSDDVHVDLSALSSPVFQGKQVILFCSDVDVVIEGLWWRRNAIGLFEAIAAGGFYAVSAMNFSLFIGECPLGQLININKSLAFCDALSNLDVPVLPHVYAVNDHQRAKWVEYLNQRPTIKTIVINTQLQRDRYSMREVALTVKELLEHTHVNVLLNGRQLRSDTVNSSGRVFTANQSGLKKRAIIENALKRESALSA